MSLVQSSQQRDSGSAVHERLKQPQHWSCWRLREYVRELVLCRDVLEVDEPKRQSVAHEMCAKRLMSGFGVRRVGGGADGRVGV